MFSNFFTQLENDNCNFLVTCVRFLMVTLTSTRTHARTHAHTHTQPFSALLDFVQDYPGEPVPESKTNLDLLEQETVSGSGISWAIGKSAP